MFIMINYILPLFCSSSTTIWTNNDNKTITQHKTAPKSDTYTVHLRQIPKSETNKKTFVQTCSVYTVKLFKILGQKDHKYGSQHICSWNRSVCSNLKLFSGLVKIKTNQKTNSSCNQIQHWSLVISQGQHLLLMHNQIL